MRRCLHCCEGSTRIIFATQWMQWDALKGISSAKLQGLARKRYTSYLCGHSAAWPGIRMAEGPRSDFAICSVFVILKIQWYPHSICRSTLQQFVGHAKNVKEHEGDVSNMLILSQAAVAVPFSCWQQQRKKNKKPLWCPMPQLALRSHSWRSTNWKKHGMCFGHPHWHCLSGERQFSGVLRDFRVNITPDCPCEYHARLSMWYFVFIAEYLISIISPETSSF